MSLPADAAGWLIAFPFPPAVAVPTSRTSRAKGGQAALAPPLHRLCGGRPAAARRPGVAGAAGRGARPGGVEAVPQQLERRSGARLADGRPPDRLPAVRQGPGARPQGGCHPQGAAVGPGAVHPGAGRHDRVLGPGSDRPAAVGTGCSVWHPGPPLESIRAARPRGCRCPSWTWVCRAGWRSAATRSWLSSFTSPLCHQAPYFIMEVEQRVGTLARPPPSRSATQPLPGVGRSSRAGWTSDVPMIAGRNQIELACLVAVPA
jgi:hypothetical protein